MNGVIEVLASTIRLINSKMTWIKAHITENSTFIFETPSDSPSLYFSSWSILIKR